MGRAAALEREVALVAREQGGVIGMQLLLLPCRPTVRAHGSSLPEPRNTPSPHRARAIRSPA